jgi:hypothetical protein
MRMTEKKKPADLTLRQFAEEMQVSYWVAHGWVSSGKVKGYKKGPFPGKTSPIMIPAAEVTRVKELMSNESNGHSKTS